MAQPFSLHPASTLPISKGELSIVTSQSFLLLSCFSTRNKALTCTFCRFCKVSHFSCAICMLRCLLSVGLQWCLNDPDLPLSSTVSFRPVYFVLLLTHSIPQYPHHYIFLIMIVRLGKMAHWLTVLTALPEDRSSVPSTHIKQLTIFSNQGI